jgi:hypothetical protein
MATAAKAANTNFLMVPLHSLLPGVKRMPPWSVAGNTEKLSWMGVHHHGMKFIAVTTPRFARGMQRVPARPRSDQDAAFWPAAAKDFVPVSELAWFEFCVFVGTAVPAEVKDFKQFVAWLKANPDQATFDLPSNGTIPHFGVYA